MCCGSYLPPSGTQHNVQESTSSQPGALLPLTQFLLTSELVDPFLLFLLPGGLPELVALQVCLQRRCPFQRVNGVWSHVREHRVTTYPVTLVMSFIIRKVCFTMLRDSGLVEFAQEVVSVVFLALEVIFF